MGKGRGASKPEGGAHPFLKRRERTGRKGGGNDWLRKKKKRLNIKKGMSHKGFRPLDLNQRG